MATVISQLLPKDKIRVIAAKLFSMPFADGNMSSGILGNDIKKNKQIPPNSAEYREISELVMTAMRENEVFNTAAIPRRILSPIFNAYGQGDQYGKHIDAAMMGSYPGMRTDLSITIFLNDPSAYEGGELTLESPFGEHEYKLDPGDAILYPTQYVHQVKPVTRGRRLAAVTWIESMVPDYQKREILSELADATAALIEDTKNYDVVRKIEKGRLNLLRMWAKT